MKTRVCLPISAGALALSIATFAAPPRPNIVFLLADDLGYGDLGCYGVKDIRTPVIDHLATEGVRFTQFYANGPECSPTRAALLTGRYQQRVGGLECAIGYGNVGRYNDAIRLRKTHDLGLPGSETSIGQLLKSTGYATSLFGKWHLGDEDKFAPSVHGFDHAFYCVGGGMDYFYYIEPAPVPGNAARQIYDLRLDGREKKAKGYYTDLIADKAEQFIAENRDRPFFLYVPFTAPHAPFQGPDEWQPHPLPNNSLRWDQDKAPPKVYAAMIERLDEATGRILKALDKQGLADNTLVIFTSDNGGTISARPCGLRGHKSMTFEGGIRVPCIARWPGKLPAGVSTTQVTMMFDLTASMIQAAGAKLPAGRTLDGVDILGRLKNHEADLKRTVFWRGRRGEDVWKAVRDGSLKYVIHLVSGAPVVEGLFDLDTDMGELHDMLDSRPEDATRLREELAVWEKEVVPVR